LTGCRLVDCSLGSQ